MSKTSIAAFLQDFSSEEQGGSDPFPEASFSDFPESVMEDMPAQELDAQSIEEKLEEIYARGLAEGREAALQEFEAAGTSAQQQLEQALQEKEDQYAASLEALGDGFVRAVEELRSIITGEVSAILRPFLVRTVAETSTQLLIEALDRVLRDPSTPLIEIRGPEKIVATLAERVRSHNIPVNCVTGEALDVQLRVGRGTVDMRLSEWISGLGA